MWEWLTRRQVVSETTVIRGPAITAVVTDRRVTRAPPAPLPPFVVAVDVETTGLHSTDKIVSLGAVWLSTACLAEHCFPISYIHLIFDPGRKSHAEAERVHGFDDWLLRHQDPFQRYAPDIRSFLAAGDVIVAHNAEFDMAFINREFIAAGLQPIDRPVVCTMQGYRAAEIGGSAALKSVLREMGLARQGTIHGALEDAWLALMVYLWLHDYEPCLPFTPAISAGFELFNLRGCPPLPEGGTPRRSSRRKIAT